MICSFGALLAWKSDDDDNAAAAAADTDADADDDCNDDRKSDPYMSPSYAGDTINWIQSKHYGKEFVVSPTGIYRFPGHVLMKASPLY